MEGAAPDEAEVKERMVAQPDLGLEERGPADWGGDILEVPGGKETGR